MGWPRQAETKIWRLHVHHGKHLLESLFMVQARVAGLDCLELLLHELLVGGDGLLGGLLLSSLGCHVPREVGLLGERENTGESQSVHICKAG